MLQNATADNLINKHANGGNGVWVEALLQDLGLYTAKAESSNSWPAGVPYDLAMLMTL